MANLKNMHIADPLAWLDTLARAESLQVLAVFVGCAAVAWLAAWALPVSYTHLTLPTICSV